MQQQPIESSHYTDDNGHPTGGFAIAKGLSITWQDGSLGRGDDRVEPNGTFVESVIFAALDRILYYQSTKFHSLENAIAAGHLRAALEVLTERTREREDRNVEGTHQI
jgi:hypothetical protein